jgi:hypothetical protein
MLLLIHPPPLSNPTIEAVMKKHNINIDSTSSSSSHGHAFSAYDFYFNITSTFSFDEWIIDSGAYYHMAKDKNIFYALNECNTKKIFVGDDTYLSVVGSGIVQVDNGHFNDVFAFQVFLVTFYQYIKSLIQVKVKLYIFHLTKL